MIKNIIDKVKFFHENHIYMAQYGLIIIVAAFLFYIPTLLHEIGFQNIKSKDYFTTEIKTPIDAIYFSIVSITTLGFGDISPVSQIMKIVVSIEVLLGIVTIGQALNAITVKAEEKKRLPHRLAAYEDVRLLSARLILYWQNIYYESVSGKLPATVDELLSQECLDKMGMSLDLDAKPNVSPPTTWWQWLPKKLDEMNTMAEKILERHIQVLDPVVYSHVHTILSDGMLSPLNVNFINSIRQSDQAMGFPRPTNLGSYLMDDAESLKPILELNKWCENEYQELQGIGKKSIKKPFQIPKLKTNNPVSSQILQNKLESQLTKQSEFITTSNLRNISK